MSIGCETCAFRVKYEARPDERVYDECIHPRSPAKYCVSNRYPGWLNAVLLGACGRTARFWELGLPPTSGDQP